MGVALWGNDLLDVVEKDQLISLSYGFSLADVAENHRCSLSTTKRRQQKINQKLGTRNCTASVAMAIRCNLV